MDQDHSMARAAVKSKKRPLSRASTSSIHSAAPQPSLDQTAFVDSASLYPQAWMPNDRHAHPKELAPAPQMSPEDMILQAATHMQSAGHDFTMDASINAAMSHHLQFQQPHQQQQQQQQQQQPQHQQHHALIRHPLPAEQFANASFTEGDSQMLDRDDNEDGDSLTGANGASKTATTTRSSANNELEMRHLFNINRHRTLQDVAGELHGNERGPNSERARQVFAMLWINGVCEKGRGSVPRGRVYANYASRCATERITVLNPASFGKLVRVLFPGLKTRRLGVRGESKYHYVNFALNEDEPDLKEPAIQLTRPISEVKSFAQNFNSAPTQSASTAQAQILPSSTSGNMPIPADSTKLLGRSHSVYNQPEINNIDNIHSSLGKTRIELAFSMLDDVAFEQSDPIALPAIDSYLPPGTDPDAAKSLSALYRSHCTSLVECIRYCREKTFFHLYTSFQGTLTMPVQKLFSQPSIAPWIEGCDVALYQRMMMIVSGLTLQVVPKPVLDTLRSISEKLVSHIRESFQGQPPHVILAKESAAAIFASLLDRALRVNLTAHAAANMLSNPANRDQMYMDWITMVRVRKVAECVPTRGMDDVVNLLITGIRDLLDPANVAWEVECLTVYGDALIKNGRQSDVEGGTTTTGQNVLDRWVEFLRNLSEKFPYASPADIVWCVERIGTAVMRDLTLAQGKSFGSWWVTKTWVDEMTSFLAEQGGFMNRTAMKPTSEQKLETRSSDRMVSTQKPRYNATSEDLNVSHSQPGRAPFPAPSATININDNTQPTLSTDSHDDSGIGIRTPEEEFPMEKFTFSGTDGQGLLTVGELGAGDDL